jgi:hypothetical protein
MWRSADYLAVFLDQGKVYAMDNYCPHAGGNLAEGRAPLALGAPISRCARQSIVDERKRAEKKKRAGENFPPLVRVMLKSRFSTTAAPGAAGHAT